MGARIVDADRAAAYLRGPFERAMADAGRARIGPAPDDLLARHPDVRVREAAVETWRARMVNEHRSSAVFAGLVPQMIEASTGFDLQHAALRAAHDEIAHAALCADVVRAFGGTPVAHAEPALTPVPRHGELAPAERLLRNLLFVGCLSETVAVGLLTEEHALASDAWVRAVLEVILADEVAHAKLGWQFVGAVAPTLDDEARARTSAYLRVAFAYLVEKELPLLPVSPALDDADVRAREAAGLCSGHDARRIFFDTLTRVVVPSLDALGFEATRAWETRTMAPDRV